MHRWAHRQTHVQPSTCLSRPSRSHSLIRSSQACQHTYGISNSNSATVYPLGAETVGLTVLCPVLRARCRRFRRAKWLCLELFCALSHLLQHLFHSRLQLLPAPGQCCLACCCCCCKRCACQLLQLYFGEEQRGIEPACGSQQTQQNQQTRHAAAAGRHQSWGWLFCCCCAGVFNEGALLRDWGLHMHTYARQPRRCCKCMSRARVQKHGGHSNKVGAVWRAALTWLAAVAARVHTGCPGPSVAPPAAAGPLLCARLSTPVPAALQSLGPTEGVTGLSRLSVTGSVGRMQLGLSGCLLLAAPRHPTGGLASCGACAA